MGEDGEEVHASYVDRCRRYSWRLDLAAPKLAAAGFGRSTPEHMGRRGEGDVVSIFFRWEWGRDTC